MSNNEAISVGIKNCLWIPLLSLMVALSGVFSGAILKWSSPETQRELKQFEVTFIEKQKAYSKFMNLLHIMYYGSLIGDTENFVVDVGALQTQYFFLEPFLSNRENDDS